MAITTVMAVSISSTMVAVSVRNASTIVDEVDVTKVAVVVVGSVVVVVVSGVT